TTGFELELALGIGGGEGAKVGTSERSVGTVAIDLRYLGDNGSSAMVAAGRREHCITASKVVLTGDIWWNESVARIGQVAVCRAANEAAVACRVIPPGCFAVRNDRRHWLNRPAFPLRLLLPVRIIAAAAVPAAPSVALVAASTIAARIVSAIVSVAALLAAELISLRLLWLLVVVLRGRRCFCRLARGRRRTLDWRSKVLLAIATAIHIGWPGSIEALGFLWCWFD
ncbi:MAG TPA: hypothetical protein VKO87_11460, partial [Gemmatimonadaceae bacterium]|nr:hypothetical protein [Gemmatimonadaceae bacterium]